MVNSQGAPVPEGFPFTVMPGAVVTTSFNRGKAPDEKSLMVLFEKHGLQEPVIEYYTKELRSKGFDVEEHYEIGDDTYAVLSLTGTREDGFRAGVVVKANLRVQATGVTARITYKGPNATEVN
ncbi:hypothetical protein AKJ08_3444 [Vulgatibacter incomptus]|uniref:Uncharacterized protein n=2 Tax=Vulgatibacter incomptus TaxID=1391653 RepID=A0A0K1PHS0_9BACT|nr:hypothetical protein AKJ08_3444 [Vulgatibacter incomptus]